MSELLDLVHNMNRLAALERTGLLDSPPEEPFDRFTRLAARICKVPIALMTLVDRDRQFFMSSFGLSEPWQTLRETPFTHSFCKHAVARRAPLVIPDTTKDPVFKDNPASRELAVVAYAGIPLEVGGQPLGAFCVVVPRAAGLVGRGGPDAQGPGAVRHARDRPADPVAGDRGCAAGCPGLHSTEMASEFDRAGRPGYNQ